MHRRSQTEFRAKAAGGFGEATLRAGGSPESLMVSTKIKQTNNNKKQQHCLSFSLFLFWLVKPDTKVSISKKQSDIKKYLKMGDICYCLLL